jgi:hypothetical protein
MKKRYEDMDWISLAQNRDQWLIPVNMVMKSIIFWKSLLSFLLAFLLLDTEDGVSMFLRNIGIFLLDYTAQKTVLFMITP